MNQVTVPAMVSSIPSDPPWAKAPSERLELAHMSDAWKTYMLANYETKRPAYRPRYSPAPGQPQGVVGGRLL
ncbi:hypothetical protein PILCRDRAFT_820891 [Piloderma croceum F 1598]|uniref:Uncharacterized protein n=1 Tax=Piloderma croceum (strain F 1598) TaxID=765440 RepID=A0A0C3FBC7_PILCF|nr:hypothetical protein PILCRDRAFT_820891 [Piloderma croceum F 1598]